MVSLVRLVFDLLSQLKYLVKQLNYKCQIILVPSGAYRVYYRVTPWRYVRWKIRQQYVSFVNYLLIKHSVRRKPRS